MSEETTNTTPWAEKIVQIEWPENILAAFATQLAAKFDGAFVYLTFGQVVPPVILGDEQEVKKQLESLKSVRSLPVGKIVVPLASFFNMVRVLQEHANRIGSLTKGKPDVFVSNTLD